MNEYRVGLKPITHPQQQISTLSGSHLRREHMIANALLTASAFVFVFALADVLLSENQKERIDVVATQLWSKFDDYKSHSLWPLFRSFRFKVVIFLVGTLTPLTVAVSLPPSPGIETLPVEIKDGFAMLIIGFVPSLATILALTWVTWASGLVVAARAVVALVLLVIGFLYGMPLVIKPVLMMMALPPPPGGYSADYGMTGFATFVLAFYSAVSMLTTMALPLIAINVLRVSIVVGEFLARRIAEYPKGSILAGSALATAALGLFKALS
jgi:hypothetical protein